MQARWWHTEAGEKGEVARCGLCVHACRIAPGGAGFCRVRRFEGAGIVSPYLGQFTSIAVDPIEKKPLRHWQPGTSILSLGGLGCTMRCPFCQNHTIAHPQKEIPPLTALDIPTLLHTVQRLKLTSVAYTYNEPTLQAEYILEAAPVLRAEDIATVLVTNGMMSAPVLEELIPWVDALNVDVKTFTASHYAKMGGRLDLVRSNIARLVQAGVHVELTCLVVPGVSDALEEFTAMVEWIAALSSAIPLHISRYFPAFRFTAPPPPIALMQQFGGIAKERLEYVYGSSID